MNLFVATAAALVAVAAAHVKCNGPSDCASGEKCLMETNNPGYICKRKCHEGNSRTTPCRRRCGTGYVPSDTEFLSADQYAPKCVRPGAATQTAPTPQCQVGHRDRCEWPLRCSSGACKRCPSGTLRTTDDSVDSSGESLCLKECTQHSQCRGMGGEHYCKVVRTTHTPHSVCSPVDFRKCSSDAQCPSTQYCGAIDTTIKACLARKKSEEQCDTDRQCESNLCVGMSGRRVCWRAPEDQCVTEASGAKQCKSVTTDKVCTASSDCGVGLFCSHTAASSTRTAGFCFKPARPNHACAADDWCVTKKCKSGRCGKYSAGVRCKQDGECSTGACYVASGSHATCGSAQCSPGCGAFQFCSRAANSKPSCSAQKKPGSSCSQDDHCVSGICHSDKCLKAVAGSRVPDGDVSQCAGGAVTTGSECMGSATANNQPCVADGDCKSKYCKEQKVGGGTVAKGLCEDKRQKGEKCTAISDCVDGLTCGKGGWKLFFGTNHCVEDAWYINEIGYDQAETSDAEDSL